ncbi:MAG: hypothetical protein OEY56_13810, partial [Cyclobacteriaceae bacterium]|nr:hypothetical protein [Cyclobacteriaceae bacterium]
MFDGPDFPGSLDEQQFEAWLEKGRESRIGYRYLLILWEAVEMTYVPAYATTRDEISKYAPFGQSTGRESLIAAYDVFSESR